MSVGYAFMKITRRKTMSEKTVYSLARGFFRGVAEKQEGRDWLRRIDNSVQFKIEGKSLFFLIVKEGQVTLEKGESSEPDLVFATDTDSYISLFEGTKTPTDLWFDGKLLLEGISRKYNEFCWLVSIFRIGQGKYYWDTSSRKAHLQDSSSLSER